MNTGRAAPAWIRPTRRAIDWTSLTLIPAALLTSATILGWRTIEVPAVIQHLAVAGLAAACVLGLGDPARPLLQALPTGPMARLAIEPCCSSEPLRSPLRYSSPANMLALSPTAEPGLAAALMALAAIGTAVHTTSNPVIDHADEAAAGAVLLWVAAAALPIPFVPDPVRTAWLTHPWPVTAAAAIVTIGAMTRRSV